MDDRRSRQCKKKERKKERKDKRTNNDLQNITHKTKDQVTRTPINIDNEI